MSNKFSAINMSFLLMLVFTIVSSLIAWYLISKAYESVFAISAVEVVQ